MKSECAAFETSLSFYRRVAQARMEILEAEQQRRRRGGSLTELIEQLPTILADGGRSSPTQARVAEVELPELELHWDDGREHVVVDETLSTLPDLDDAALSETLETLRAFEREISGMRRGLHGVLDAIEHEIATRRAAGTF